MSDKCPENRTLYIDVLKSIAIVCVLIIHSTSVAFTSYEPRSAEYFFTVILTSFARISVPVFVMCSGSVFLSKSKICTIRSIYTKYIPRLLASLLVFSFFYEIVTVLVFYSVTGVFDKSVISNSIKNLFVFNNHFHLYYLYIIILIYALVPIIKTFLNSSNRKLDFYTLVFLFVMSNLIPTMRMYFPFDTYFRGMTLHYTLNLVYGMLSYFFLGYYLSTYTLCPKKEKMIYFLGVMGLIVTFYGNYINTTPDGLLTEGYINANTAYIYFMAAALFLLTKRLCGNASNKKSFFVSLSKSSFCIYLIHEFYNIVFRRFGFTLTFCTPFVSLPIMIFANLILSYITYLILRKIPLVKRLV